MTPTYTRSKWLLIAIASMLTLIACTKSAELSTAQAKQHVAMLVTVAAQDVAELERGMPEGAAKLRTLLESKTPPKDDLEGVRQQLDRARNGVQDLRVAKSTFFAFVDRDGTILRGDREPDILSGRNLFVPFPETRQSLEGKVVVTRGEMPEAAGVKGKRDGQLVYSVPISHEGSVGAIYATGWSWAAYAYRLQNAVLSDVRSKKKNENDKAPLIYVYLVVEDAVFGAPVAPEVNAQAIKQLAPMTKLSNNDVDFATVLEITGRDFGLAVKRAPSLGPNVAIAVLRSET